MKIKLKIQISFWCLLSVNVFAQDIHFSNIEYSPLNLNPALAGANSHMQGIVNYRSQWSSVASPYSTIAASFDLRLKQGFQRKSEGLAMGINVFNDRSGNLNVETSSINLNLAYHLFLNSNSKLGVGIYSGFGQLSTGKSDRRWGSQFDGKEYNSSFPSESITNIYNNGFFDAGAGLIYCFKKKDGFISKIKKRELQCGLAVYHLNQPNYSIISKNGDRLFIRYSAFVNGDFKIANSKGSFLPGIYVQRQSSFMEIMYGFHYKISLNEESVYTEFKRPLSIYFGAFNRFKDSMIYRFMLEWDRYSIGVAYDSNISHLVSVSNMKGGTEIFLRFNMSDNDGLRMK
jgi:type IX secretion system PorP/SprF family membrane protein